ncbi:MAG TPA: TIGR04283 family arsenosugar biosynthesis glycosyltransferase [Thermodesulfobacteriota bacterium]|nr:TIGR04283 family arsenosugar biosynthesis glycosyltransferase [Thermodesulfobacteriota bacterium]
MKISVIIPVLNEEENVSAAICSVLSEPGVEVIISDGGSSDSTVQIAEGFSRVRIVRTSKPSRGLQMDEGALSAKGDVFLFLHADTVLPPNWSEAIKKCLNDKAAIAGAFTFSIASPGISFRLIEFFSSLRCCLFTLPFGDQAIFVGKEAFFNSGGFMGLPLMEDVNIIGRLKTLGKVCILKEIVSASPRRWLKKGRARNTFKNWFVFALYLAGVSPDRLYRYYYCSR